MKKRTVLLLALCLFLLTACAGAGTPAPGGTPSDPDFQNPGSEGTQPAVIEDGPPWFATFRIVAGAETGDLVLAENGEAGAGIYTLSMGSLEFEPQFTEPLRNGQLINVYYESFTEAWPMDLGGVSAIELVEGGFDDRTALYLDVLEDLWEADSGLNDGVEVIGVDLSQTSLSPAEQAAAAWIFAGNHGVELVEGTLEALMDQGYITGDPLGTEDAPSDAKFWHWENGCHFSITEQPMEGTYSLTPVTFDAMKWRSSLGTYFFSDCTAVQSALGDWSEYRIGAEMIS